MIYPDELSINLQVSNVLFFDIGFRSKFESKRTFSLPDFLRKSNLRKLVYGFFHSNWNSWGKTHKLNLTIWMSGLMSWMIGSLHEFNLTGLFPNVLNTSHVTVYVQRNNVLEAVKRKCVLHIIHYVVPIQLNIKNVVSHQLLYCFTLLPIINDLYFVVFLVQNELQ